MVWINFQFLIKSDKRHGVGVHFVTPLFAVWISFLEYDVMMLRRFSGVTVNWKPTSWFKVKEGDMQFNRERRMGFYTELNIHIDPVFYKR